MRDGKQLAVILDAERLAVGKRRKSGKSEKGGHKPK